MRIMRGTRISTMTTRTATTATTTNMFVPGDSAKSGIESVDSIPFLSDEKGQLLLFPTWHVRLEALYESYFSARKNKRKSSEIITFDIDREENLIRLQEELNTGCYEISPSKVFIVEDPVKREIFAASFRDRIIHHYLIERINPCIEKNLIYDCYACREGKGTLFGIKRISHFARSITQNYTRTAWYLKLDIKGFFMSIDKNILAVRLIAYIEKEYKKEDKDLILYLLKKIIGNNPVEDVIFRSSSEKWNDLDKNKSLFFTKAGCGLPIGNLTSQIFANFYMSYLDHYIKHHLKIRYYGRYVDDFILMHEDKDYLKLCHRNIILFLEKELHLVLNHRKTILQKVEHGIKFLGTVIEIRHENIRRRTVRNINTCTKNINKEVKEGKPDKAKRKIYQARINSYLGLIRHYDTYKLRTNIIMHMDYRLIRRASVQNDKTKVLL